MVVNILFSITLVLGEARVVFSKDKRFVIISASKTEVEYLLFS